MPRIIVMSGPSTARTTLDERISSADLESGHYAAQLIERVGWAVHDADDAEREDVVDPQSPDEQLSGPVKVRAN